MPKKKIICAHVLVKNEANFLWYAVMSVYKYVDRIRLWDMGSTDNTRDIIEEIQKLPDAAGKVFFHEVTFQNFSEAQARRSMLDATPPTSDSDENENFFPWVREQMLKATKADWFLVVDGDEIWWEDSIKKVTDLIQEKGDSLESIVTPTILPVGDMFHFQEKAAGRYKLAKRVGHYNLRAINRKIPGLGSSDLPHGRWGWVDDTGKMIQDRDPDKIAFLDAPYFHASYLPRAGKQRDKDVIKRAKKHKHEIGISFPKDFYYPEVFFRPRPAVVASPWRVMNVAFGIRSFLETPIKKIKRRIWWGKAGY